MRYGIVLLVTIVIGGCSGSQSENVELNAARELWRQSNIKNYQFKCHRLQGGSFIWKPERVEVINGEFASIKTLDGMPQYNSYIACREFGTVEAMFDLLQSKHNANAKFDVAYDSQFGFPTEARIGKTLGTDASYIIKISEFTITDPKL